MRLVSGHQFAVDIRQGVDVLRCHPRRDWAVDDEGQLVDAGLVTEVAKDGEEALKLMMTTPCHLVISDFNMPKIDGIQLLRALRQHGPTSKVGFILVTGKGDKALIDEGKKWGLNNFLAKPFTVPALKTCIEAVVGKLT